jgi:hypothetical protein
MDRHPVFIKILAVDDQAALRMPRVRVEPRPGVRGVLHRHRRLTFSSSPSIWMLRRA